MFLFLFPSPLLIFLWWGGGTHCIKLFKIQFDQISLSYHHKCLVAIVQEGRIKGIPMVIGQGNILDWSKSTSRSVLPWICPVCTDDFTSLPGDWRAVLLVYPWNMKAGSNTVRRGNILFVVPLIYVLNVNRECNSVWVLMCYRSANRI